MVFLGISIVISFPRSAIFLGGWMERSPNLIVDVTVCEEFWAGIRYAPQTHSKVGLRGILHRGVWWL
jgi:hypothetical protein